MGGVGLLSLTAATWLGLGAHEKTYVGAPEQILARAMRELTQGLPPEQPCPHFAAFKGELARCLGFAYQKEMRSGVVIYRGPDVEGTVDHNAQRLALQQTSWQRDGGVSSKIVYLNVRGRGRQALTLFRKYRIRTSDLEELTFQLVPQQGGFETKDRDSDK